jgi:hypothetical protein
MTARALLLTLGVVAACPVGLWAQVRASEHAVAAQTVDGTTLTVTYSRPRTRGRAAIYGKVIPWGEVWTPGANWATTLEVDKDVTINGHALAKGKYSVWMEVQPKEWTVILDPKARAFHTEHPKPDSSQVRFAVTPDNVSGPDILTWSFPEVSSAGTTLRMAWAGRSVSLAVAVSPSHPLTCPADLAERYVGDYTFLWVSRDTTEAQPDSAETRTSVWHVTYTKGMLLVDWAPPPFPEWAHLVLIKVTDNWFNPGAMVDGQLFDVANDLIVEFAVSDGKATGFEIRSENDEVIGRATRTN